MSPTEPTRFDVDALRGTAGEKIFDRGDDYHRAGLVEILAIEPGRVLALVEGTETYRTELRGRGATIEGECSCPAYVDWGFCKHMVAAALAANALGDGAAEAAGALARIRTHLESRSVGALVELIMSMVEADPVLFRKLDLAAAAVHGDEGALEARLRRAIDTATDTRGYVDHYETRAWVDGVAAALDSIAEIVGAGRAAPALRLAEYALERIDAAIEDIVDSDGCTVMLLGRARDFHLNACRAAKPDPLELARDLFAREIEEDYDTFRGAAHLYADCLGEEGLGEYRARAEAAWEALPPRGGVHSGGGFNNDYSVLMDILDYFAERGGDVEARIALRRKDLSSQWKYLVLVEFCRANDRAEEALRHAEEGLWMFEDERRDERLLFCAADLLVESGRGADAQAHLWRAFEREPGLELFTRLGKLGGAPAKERALAHLQDRLGKEAPTPWYSAADLLIQVLCEEKLFDAAWAVVREHRVSSRRAEALAEASETTHPREAIAVYAARVDALVEAGGNPSYEEAARFVTRMGALRDASEQAAYVADLMERFRRKRNFMKLLA